MGTLFRVSLVAVLQAFAYIDLIWVSWVIVGIYVACAVTYSLFFVDYMLHDKEGYFVREARPVVNGIILALSYKNPVRALCVKGEALIVCGYLYWQVDMLMGFVLLSAFFLSTSSLMSFLHGRYVYGVDSATFTKEEEAEVEA